MANILAESWYPTRRAAELVGVNRRTLQRRAAAGLIQTRTADTGETEYLLGGAVTRPATPTTAVATRDSKAPHTLSRRDDTPTTSVAPELVGALVAAVERATRAELALAASLAELDQARTERDQFRAAATDLASALQKRAVIVRDLARRVGALERAR